MGNTSGQQNQNDFKAQLAMGQLPDPTQTSLTYEGVFNSHYFKLNKICQQKTLALQSQFAITNDFLSLEQNQKFWASCFLTSKYDGRQRGENEFIDASIVLDVSGSMSGNLTNSNSNDKLTLAKYSINQLLENSLKPQDSFSLSIFNNTAQTVQKFSKIEDLNLDNLKAKINTIKANGGTDLEYGLKQGIDQFNSLEPNYEETKNPEIQRIKRVIFITDMCGIQGEQVKSLIEMAGKENIYVSFIGVGISFNSQLTETLSAQKGCNYFAITKEEEVKEVLVDHFYYNYFPTAFDVNLQVESTEFEIQQVYGTPFSTEKNKQLLNDNEFQSVTEINTMFAGDVKEFGDQHDILRGGLILLKLNKKSKQLINQDSFIKFKLSYTDARNNQFYEDNYELKINKIEQNEQQLPIIFSQDSIRRGIIYQQYIEMSKQIINRMGKNQCKTKLQQFELDSMKSFYDNLKYECDNYEQSDDINDIKEQFNQLLDIIIKVNNEIDENQKDSQLQDNTIDHVKV